MEQYEEISKLMERVIHKYNQVEKTKRPYGTDTLLSRTEIHTIVAIGDSPDINVTQLAKAQGVTKGAASQMVYKLVDKGFVKKRVSPHSDTEVCLTLTSKGNDAYQAHQEYHQTTNEPFFEMLRQIPEDLGREAVRILSAFDKALDERMKQE